MTVAPPQQMEAPMAAAIGMIPVVISMLLRVIFRFNPQV
jgi:hypothetical protein